MPSVNKYMGVSDFYCGKPWQTERFCMCPSARVALDLFIELLSCVICVIYSLSRFWSGSCSSKWLCQLPLPPVLYLSFLTDTGWWCLFWYLPLYILIVLWTSVFSPHCLMSSHHNCLMSLSNCRLKEAGTVLAHSPQELLKSNSFIFLLYHKTNLWCHVFHKAFLDSSKWDGSSFFRVEAEALYLYLWQFCWYLFHVCHSLPCHTPK